MSTSGISGATVAITGGLGFIGTRVAERLGEAGVAQIVILDRNAPGTELRDVAPRTRIVSYRVALGEADAATLRSSLSGVDFLIHLAAEKHSSVPEHGEEILKTNVLGTHTLFDAARVARVEKIVFASSVYAYGRIRGGPLVESEVRRPTTIYGISKLAGEDLGLHFASNGGPGFVALRFFFVYGPRQSPLRGRSSLIARTFERLSSGEPPVIHGDGSQALDYVYIDDAAEATLAALESAPSGEVFNVGSGAAHSVRDLVRKMQETAHTSLAPVNETEDDTANTSRVASTEKIATTLHWTPRTTLDEGLERTWSWIRAQV